MDKQIIINIVAVIGFIAFLPVAGLALGGPLYAKISLFSFIGSWIFVAWMASKT